MPCETRLLKQVASARFPVGIQVRFSILWWSQSLPAVRTANVKDRGDRRTHCALIDAAVESNALKFCYHMPVWCPINAANVELKSRHFAPHSELWSKFLVYNNAYGSLFINHLITSHEQPAHLPWRNWLARSTVIQQTIERLTVQACPGEMFEPSGGFLFLPVSSSLHNKSATDIDFAYGNHASNL
jgi:hypothetical protein